MRLDNSSTAEALNVAAALRRLGEDRALFDELTSIVLEDAPRLARELASAIRAQEAPAVELKAHALKGLVAGCGGERAALAAQALEDAGGNQNLLNAASQMADLELELQAMADAIRAHRTSSAARQTVH